MKAFKRMLCLALVAMMLCAAALPAYAATKTIYLSSKDGGTEWFWLDLGTFKSGAKITDVKSSKNSVVKVTRLSINRSDYTNIENKKNSRKSVYAEISGRAYKTGSANITYKLNGKAKKQPITVKGYVNPVKSLVFTGISSKNLKSEFDKQDYAIVDVLQKDAGAGYLKLSAASGWKIEHLYFEDYSAEEGEVDYTFSAWSKPVSSVSLHLPELKAGVRYRLYANFINTKTKGEHSINYEFDPYDYYD